MGPRTSARVATLCRLGQKFTIDFPATVNDVWQERTGQVGCKKVGYAFPGTSAFADACDPDIAAAVRRVISDNRNFRS